MAGQGRMAKDIRAGLDQTTPTPVKPHLTVMQSTHALKKRDPLDARYFGKPVSLHVKEFGQLFGLIFLGLAAFALYFHGIGVKSTIYLSLATVFLVLGYQSPRLLYPLWNVWMGFAERLGAVMSFLILSIAWTIMVVPMGLLLRIIRKKVMILSFRTNESSYWEVRDSKLDNPKLLERQF